jgi:hypothetical protein
MPPQFGFFFFFSTAAYSAVAANSAERKTKGQLLSAFLQVLFGAHNNHPPHTHTETEAD